MEVNGLYSRQGSKMEQPNSSSDSQLEMRPLCFWSLLIVISYTISYIPYPHRYKYQCIKVKHHKCDMKVWWESTNVNATKRLVSDQSGFPGVWPCHCNLSAVGKSFKPSDSHSLHDFNTNQIIKMQNRELWGHTHSKQVLTGGTWSQDRRTWRDQMKTLPFYPTESSWSASQH